MAFGVCTAACFTTMRRVVIYRGVVGRIHVKVTVGPISKSGGFFVQILCAAHILKDILPQ